MSSYWHLPPSRWRFLSIFLIHLRCFHHPRCTVATLTLGSEQLLKESNQPFFSPGRYEGGRTLILEMTWAALSALLGPIISHSSKLAWFQNYHRYAGMPSVTIFSMVPWSSDCTYMHHKMTCENVFISSIRVFSKPFARFWEKQASKCWTKLVPDKPGQLLGQHRWVHFCTQLCLGSRRRWR